MTDDPGYLNIHQEYIDRCRKGNREAQFELYRLYYKSMYNTSLRIVKDAQEAEDIMQESFLSAFEKIDTKMTELISIIKEASKQILQGKKYKNKKK